MAGTGALEVQMAYADRLAESNLVPNYYRGKPANILVALGYAVGLDWLGWLAALAAAITAYIRVLGGTLGLAQDFRGPQAKPHRMAVLTVGCLLGIVEWAWRSEAQVLRLALGVIVVGTIATCGTRLAAISRQLKAR